MHLEGRPWREVRVRAARPRLLAPVRVHEGCRLRHVFGAEHVAQHGEHLRLGRFVVLRLDGRGLGLHHHDEEDARAREEALGVERLEHWVVTTCNRVGVEVELRRRIPEDFFGRELHEDHGKCAHFEALDARLLPVGQLGLEGDELILEYAKAGSNWGRPGPSP